MAEKLHVLHVVGAMDIGGIENMLMTLMPYMREKGIIFDFAVHGEFVGVHESNIKEMGGNVYHVPKFVGVNIISYFYSWCKMFIDHPELKIIHGHMTSTACIYLLIAKLYSRTAIAHSHNTGQRGNLISKYIKSIMEFPLRYIADYFFACSRAAAVFRFGNNILKKTNYMLWKNAIATEKFRFNEEKRRIYRQKLGISSENFLIGHVGRMTISKNHMYLLDVFACFHKKQANSQLLLLGDGELHGEVRKKINDLNIQDSVIDLGAVNNPADYLSAMDVFCLPSKWEGFGVAIIEAQVNGLPCLVSDCIQNECIISDDVCMLSIENDAKVWSDKLLEHPLRRKRNIYNPYDVKEISGWVIDFYRKISK